MSLQGRILADAPASGPEELLERLAAACGTAPPPAPDAPASRAYLIAGRPVTLRQAAPRGAGGR